jgi:hypothetical protein
MEKQHRRPAGNGGWLVPADKIQAVTGSHRHDAHLGKPGLGRFDAQEIDREYQTPFQHIKSQHCGDIHGRQDSQQQGPHVNDQAFRPEANSLTVMPNCGPYCVASTSNRLGASGEGIPSTGPMRLRSWW